MTSRKTESKLSANKAQKLAERAWIKTQLAMLELEQGLTFGQAQRAYLYA